MGYKTIPAQAALAIRKELAKAFWRFKFSVTSKSYSGGSSVTIEWTNGPTKDQVEKIVNKYQQGHFDGMTDSYEYSNRDESIPQVKFVFCERRLTDDKFAFVWENYVSKWEQFKGATDMMTWVDCGHFGTNGRTPCWEILSKIDLRDKLTIEKIVEA